MPKLIVMQGLPASGKSTKAKELLKQGNTVRLNKDLIRKMLHMNKFSGKNEKLTISTERKLAENFLKEGLNVIIDDTNLNPKVVNYWKELSKTLEVKLEYHKIETSVSECMMRDLIREDSVGWHVIQKMALQYTGYLKGEKAVICDLDGTLCNIEHRLKYASGPKKDWSKFFSGIPFDELRDDVEKSVRKLALDNNAFLILVSGRPEDYRDATEEWLARMAKITPDKYILIMRESHDKRDDDIVKLEIYEKYLSNLNILKVFDDRPRVIRMWRERGLEVEDVGNGVEF